MMLFYCTSNSHLLCLLFYQRDAIKQHPISLFTAFLDYFLSYFDPIALYLPIYSDLCYREYLIEIVLS